MFREEECGVPVAIHHRANMEPPAATRQSYGTGGFRLNLLIR
jgi:hypothetical protein